MMGCDRSRPAPKYKTKVNVEPQCVASTAAGAKKMNIGALGNMVPQLHVHVIARFEQDAAWPAPVWGKYPAVAYDEENLAAMTALGKEFIDLYITGG